MSGRCLAFVVLLGALSATRVAQARSILVFPLTGDPGADQEDLFQMGEAVASALRKRGHNVLGPVETVERVESRSPGCVTSRRTSCWADVANQIGRDTIVSGRVVRNAQASEATVTLEACESRNVRVIADESHTTVILNRADLQALAHAVALMLSESLPPPRATCRLRVDSDPSGARIEVNGVAVGVTPWGGEVAEGPALLRVELDGREPETRELVLEAGGSQDVRLTLRVAREPGIRRSGTERQFVGPMVVGGAGAVGVGIALYGMAVPESCAQWGQDKCLVTDDTAAWPAIALYGGLGLIGIGSAVIWYFASGGSVEEPPASVSIDSTGLRVAGRF